MQDGLLHFIIQFKIQGISEGQREAIKAIEVSAMRNAIKSLGLQIQIIFICIEKNTTMKFYNIQNENSMNNCPPGTLIDDPQICKEDEFFLICQKTFQGIPNPTHYFILVNDLIKSMNQEQANKIKKSIEILCFKLCHLYFNWVGAIKVPAPCVYAHRLSNLVGDRWAHLDFIPHANLSTQKSLYFI
eukprot:TRINITY_DN40983_c0_g1_i3.p1 TRINITY_DN40983_c0_g1~~TRINITY_DN40983_c0_g1_i3.p1  ORF type:complete len:187 (+),score=30.46 TRINITY_DN40983_c0_g1_i3:1-561(+)